MTYPQLALGKRHAHWPLVGRIRDAVRVLRGEPCEGVDELWDRASESANALLELKRQLRRLREKSRRS